MKKLLTLGVGLAIVLSSGMAFANSEAFQTLGNVTGEETALTAMSGEQLEAIEGKLRYNGDLGRYVGRYVASRYKNNTSNVTQSNNCHFCGNGNGGFNGGNANLGVAQGNQNGTGQSIGFPFLLP